MCHLAKHNNVLVSAVSADNCNVQTDQRCCGGDSALDHYRFASSTNYGFVANERYMYDAMATDAFTYVAVLRDAWSRYTSHYLHVARIKHLLVTPRAFSRWLSGQPDNWAVRHICGTRCMATPKYALSRDDFAYAQQRLARFHFVARLEHPSELEALLGFLGWRGDVSARKNASPPYSAHLWGRAKREFQKMTVLDDCLYANVSLSTSSSELYFSEQRYDSNAGPCGIAGCTPY